MGCRLLTPGALVNTLANPELARRGLRSLASMQGSELVDLALDQALEEDPELATLSHGIGFRGGVHAAIDELRMADASLEEWRGIAAARGGAGRRLLTRTLAVYEQTLHRKKLADAADEAMLALRALLRWHRSRNRSTTGSPAAYPAWPPAMDADEVRLLSGLRCVGLVGLFLQELLACGAELIPAPRVGGLDAPAGVLWANEADPAPGGLSFLEAPDQAPGPGQGPDIAFFRAASHTDELRGALRRILSAGLHWDEVEIIASDTASYGSALHALAKRLGVEVTYEEGLGVARTRVGRALRMYFDWVEGGFHQNVVRRLLESGDLRPAGSTDGPLSGDLARRFRTLRVGWGRDRYLAQLAVAKASSDRREAALDRPGTEVDDGATGLPSPEATELEALESILQPILASAPSRSEPTSAARIAVWALAFLEHVPRGAGLEADVRKMIVGRLEAIRNRLTRRTNFAAASAIVRRECELRVPGPRLPERTQGKTEPGSAGTDALAATSSTSRNGCLHLASLGSGGLTGRRAAFLVGMDADRVPGRAIPTPLLRDGDRDRLNAAAFRSALGSSAPRPPAPRLLSTPERVEGRRFELAALAARLTGFESVTMSYAAWDAAEGAAKSPSPVLLQAYRIAENDPELGFEDLDGALGRIEGPVPRSTAASGRRLALLDEEDVWLAELGEGGGLASGSAAVREAFPGLRAGHALFAAKLGVPGPAQGVVGRIHGLSPHLPPRRAVSATSLEALGACPLRYLHRDVLGTRPPEDPEFDRVRWLDPVARGGLLHRVFASTLGRARARKIELRDAAFERLALDELDGALRRAREVVPLPGEGAASRERRALRADVRSFVHSVREREPKWIALEHGFGRWPGDDSPEASLEVGGCRVVLKGSIDRVDEAPGGMRVIDYKTGRPRTPPKNVGSDRAFHGGRRLQHALYARVAERIFERPVAEAGYLYPTAAGENVVQLTPADRLAALDAMLPEMLKGVDEGRFVPTNDPSDCRYCDYAAACRPEALATWSAAGLASNLPVFGGLYAARCGEPMSQEPWLRP